MSKDTSLSALLFLLMTQYIGMCFIHRMGSEGIATIQNL